MFEMGREETLLEIIGMTAKEKPEDRKCPISYNLFSV